MIFIQENAAENVIGKMAAIFVMPQYVNSSWPTVLYVQEIYRKIYNIRCTKSQKLKWFSSRLAVVFAQSIEARCQVENEDIIGAAPTGAAPTISEWSTI